MSPTVQNTQTGDSGSPERTITQDFLQISLFEAQYEVFMVLMNIFGLFDVYCSCLTVSYS